jgi:hypothetical protein
MNFIGRAGLLFVIFFAMRMSQVLGCPDSMLCQSPPSQEPSAITNVFSVLYLLTTLIQIPFVMLTDALASGIFGAPVADPFAWLLHPAVSAAGFSLGIGALTTRASAPARRA